MRRPPLRERINRLLLRVLSKRRGPTAAIRDLRYVRELIRFFVLFASLVLVPVVLLAGLALRSLETEELGLDANLQTRADAIADQVQRELERTFDRFERDVLTRVGRGEVAAERLYERMPYLRAMFRIDAEGRLGFPFAEPDPADLWTVPSPPVHTALTHAARASMDGRHADAIAAVDGALDQASTPSHRAALRLERARAELRGGTAGALEDLTLLVAEFPRARDRRGVRYGDLATLLRAEILEESGEEAQALQLLVNLVERNLASAWVPGLPGEALATRLALERLRDRYDRRWHRIATSQLETRLDRLYWATHVADELALIGSRTQPAEGRFVYHTEERSLWATTVHQDALWAFSFDYEGLQRQLGDTVLDVANRVDPDLSAALVRVDDDVGSAIVRRSMAPLLPLIAVAVRPIDPVALANGRRRTRAQRRLVLLLALLATTLGMVAAVRVVNQELDAARVKADFAANVSHELRSPITQIRLKGEALQLDLVFSDEDRRAHYDAIVREAERLSRLVDNVLDFSSIEHGRKTYSLRPGDVGSVLQRAATAIRPAAETAGMDFEVDIPDDLPVVWFDGDAVAQVAINLLSNAIKYGSDGDFLRIAAEATEDGVEFRVEDRGIGISPEDQEHIFDHFYRVQSADVRKRRGTGIGLTIVQYIVQAHHGTIRVESAEGEGTTFFVTFPTEPPDAAGG